MAVHKRTLARSLSLLLLVAMLALTGASVSLAQDAERGGVLTYAYLQKARSLDPNVWTGRSDNDIMRQMFDSLIYSPAPGEYTPWLAASWDVSDDGLVYTFTLRDDVTFHDGTPLNADAVKATYDRMLDPETASLQVGNLGPYDRTEVLGEYEFAIHLTEPFAPLLANLSSTALAPGSPAAFEALGDDYALSAVGTGPFMFDRWEGNDLYLARNPDYNWAPDGWNHEGPAYLEQIIFREVAEPATRMVTLQTGEANIIHYPVLDEVASYEEQGFAVHRVDTPGFAKSMPINIQLTPTDDLLVRQAVLYGINRQQVVDLIQAGLANVAYGPLTRASFGYDPAVEEMYNYDPERAAALLDEAGWVDANGDGIREKDGQNLVAQMIIFDSGVNKATAELVQAMLAQLGFEATLDVTAYDAFATRVTDGTYNFAEMNWTALDPHLVLFNMFYSSEVTGGGQFNRTRIEDPAIDELIARGRSATDLEERAAIYAELQTYVMENALILPLWDNSWITLTAPGVDGLVFDLEARPLLFNVWVE
ncbi:MAG: ABC transporter substrate-binding protein [Chloroflexia bacterium]|nr:ABC transporter substrate-binding protein [Chloroflexia bacterium]